MLRSRPGKVDDPASFKRTAVIDADNNRFVVLLIGNVNKGVERQCPVCGSKIILIVNFSAACFQSLEMIMIKRCFAVPLQGILFKAMAYARADEYNKEKQ